MNILFILLLSFSTFAQSFLPPNDLRIPIGDKEALGISEADFNQTLNDLEKLYTPIIASRGGKFNVTRDWVNETVNAFAEQKNGKWKVSFFGGLARHKTMTKDGFALIVCHEIGHHLGGAPRYASLVWASNEGQSDYFATTKCLRRYWQGQDHDGVLRSLELPEPMKKACSTTSSPKLCMRESMAGYSVALLFAALNWNPFKPKFDQPDRKQVKKTNDSHPASQCRLDTYFQGALCDVSYKDDFDAGDESVGACHSRNGQTVGLRPRCWFNPQE